NAHATATSVGDLKELEALREVFREANRIPPFTSTKSQTGHALGAAGVHEAIYSLIMMEHNFIAASVNVDEPDEAVGDMPLVTERIDDAEINCVMSNSFGFGGTNAALAFKRFDG
ncbi:MAG: beta-ketoacyl-ACP synthase I, partial [Alphaproteobacteria bacterium]